MVNESPELFKKLLYLKELELNSLLEVTQAINANLPEEALYKIYHFTLLANLNINKIALYVLDEKWECKVNYGTKESYKLIELHPAILEYSKISSIDDSIPEFKEFDTVIPISHKLSVLAYVFISSAKKDSTTDEVNFSFLQTFTNIILVAIENKKLARKELVQQAFRKELEIAKEVQSFLFPKNLPSTPEVTIKASYHPHDAIGGDYYDYIKLSEDSFLVCIADVSGKGIPAAILMSNFQASLRTLVRQRGSLKETLEALNANILDNAKGERFITFFVGIIELKKRTLTYINAGHNPPMLLMDKEVILLDKGTTILGVFNKLPFINEAEVAFPKGSLLFAYTDGLTETAAEDGEEYGHERLQAFLQSKTNLDEQMLHVDMYQELLDFKGKSTFPDDITYWTCKLG